MGRTAARLGGGGALLLAVLYAVGSYFMAAAVTEAERHEVEMSPADLGLRFEDVSFPSRDAEIELSAWFLPAAPADARDFAELHAQAPMHPQPVIVMVHGIHATRESDEALPLAQRWVAAGFHVLMFDLRGHGRSGGEDVSGGYFEQNDLLGAIDYARQRLGASVPIGVFGRSMGGAVALLTAADDDRIAGLVADSAYADVTDLLPGETSRATGLPEAVVELFIPGVKFCGRRFFRIDIDALVPEQAVTRIDIPVLLMHGTEDTRVPVEHGHRIRAAHAVEGTELCLIEGVDHVEGFESDPHGFALRTLEYFQERLSP